MTLSKTILTSFLLVAINSCFGMELPPETLRNHEEIEALFDDHDLAQEIQKTLPCNEKIDLKNDTNEIAEGANAISVSKKRRYECPTCKKSVINLIEHMDIHMVEKPFKCDRCKYSCRRRDHLIVHQRTHTHEKPFKCEQCDYSFTQTSNLKRHMNKKHKSPQMPTETQKKDYIWHQVYADAEKK